MLWVIGGLWMLSGACGCGSPSKANIELRKQNQALSQQIEHLQLRRAGDQAIIRQLEAGATTVPVLPGDRLAELFTVHGLSFGRLTGGADLDPLRRGDEAIKVYIVPTDQYGDALKAAGGFRVQAFDLADPGEALLGTWDFPADNAAKNWYSGALLNTYILTCPWQRIPQHRELTLRVSFTDALTRGTFTAQRQITVDPPPAPATTAPTTSALTGN